MSQQGGAQQRLLPNQEIVTQSSPLSFQRLQLRGLNLALERAFGMTTKSMIQEVQDSGIVGRGGAAFPAGLKWLSVNEAAGHSKYVVMNADESEPGTFKDRVLLELDPLLPLAGLAMAAHGVGAHKAYVYLRGEYRHLFSPIQQAWELLERAMPQVLVPLEVRLGAGAYIAGEETALFNSIEGKRPEPRLKPPFPTVQGLFLQPTLIHNVETLANIALLFRDGADRFRAYGSTATPGTKLVSISGRVNRPGVYEVPFGIPLLEILEGVDTAQGMQGGQHLQAVLLGGAAGSFLTAAEVGEATYDYPDLRRYGASIGSGALVVFGQSDVLPEVAQTLAQFFAEESCGQCVPCRIGTVRIKEMLEQFSLSEKQSDLRDLAQTMRDASICGLGQSATTALISLLDRPVLWNWGL
ncbi:electron transport complex protein RnfC [Alicyclobacillaceae bacterium I2511]|nr:electron transport complex protein RnfC [Alicyclobacillaceae bacterium I2511]